MAVRDARNKDKDRYDTNMSKRKTKEYSRPTPPVEKGVVVSRPHPHKAPPSLPRPVGVPVSRPPSQQASLASKDTHTPKAMMLQAGSPKVNSPTPNGIDVVWDTPYGFSMLLSRAISA